MTFTIIRFGTNWKFTAWWCFAAWFTISTRKIWTNSCFQLPANITGAGIWRNTIASYSTRWIAFWLTMEGHCAPECVIITRRHQLIARFTYTLIIFVALAQGWTVWLATGSTFSCFWFFKAIITGTNIRRCARSIRAITTLGYAGLFLTIAGEIVANVTRTYVRMNAQSMETARTTVTNWSAITTILLITRTTGLLCIPFCVILKNYKLINN